MKDRKLRLVPPAAPAPGGGGDEPPFTEEELREARAFGEAVERGDEPISSSLRAAWRPAVLDDAAHAALVERAIEARPASIKEVDPVGERRPGSDPPISAGAIPEASDEERRAAERLRAGLEAVQGGATPLRADPHAELAQALRAAVRPSALDPQRNEVLIATALANAPRRLTVSRIFATVATITALAAGVALIVRTEATPPPHAAAPAAAATAQSAPAQASAPALIKARSTLDLFDAAEPFPRTGGESKRIDKIASSRAADLRANRFAAWGVR